MINPALRKYLSVWHLEPDGATRETPSSFLLPVKFAGMPAMLKVFKPGSDEQNAGPLLQYFDGNGAVRLFASEAGALLLERIDGPSLMGMALTGGDLRAAGILAKTVAGLHAARERRLPDELTPLREWFLSLFEHGSVMPLLGRCASVARELLDSEHDIVPLHGDLHHDNVLDGGARGYLAIDPKALIGERSYEIANLLGNPWPHGEIVHRTDRMRRLSQLYAARLGLDPQRVLAFAFAHAGLAASWDIEDGNDPTFRLRCAEVLAPLVGR
jgi:streptomycin 6-kinase